MRVNIILEILPFLIVLFNFFLLTGAIIVGELTHWEIIYPYHSIFSFSAFIYFVYENNSEFFIYLLAPTILLVINKLLKKKTIYIKAVIIITLINLILFFINEGHFRVN